MKNEFANLYDFTGQSIIITGGAGIIGSEMAPNCHW
jgi:FlaA1/EpsC-like NDP-sugar epimerase